MSAKWTPWTNLPGETWREVVGFPGYRVSSLGRLVSFREYAQGYLLTPGLNSRGYLFVNLPVAPGKRGSRTVHQLVTAAFHGPRPVHLVTRHLDGDKRNNRADNLTYGTRVENAQDAIKHGQNPYLSRATCPQGHHYNDINTYVDSQGWRKCRPCRAEAQRRYLQRQAVAS